MKRKLLVLCLAVLALLILGGCSNKKETVKEDLTAFLNAELETWRAEGYTIEGIHANDISVEVSSIIDDPRYKGCYIATLDFNITTEETVDPDIFWLSHELSSLYSDSAAKRFREEYGHDVVIDGADSLDSFFYQHYNVTLNGVLVHSSKQQGDWAEEYFEEFVAEYGDDGGDSGAHCRRCGTGYRYGSTGYNLIKENGYCGNCRNNIDD